MTPHSLKYSPRILRAKTFLQGAFITLIAVSFFSCAKDNDPPSQSPSIEPGKSLEYVKDICKIASRNSGSQGSQKNIAYLSSKLKELNVAFELDRWQEATADGNTSFCNIISEIRGQKDDFIIIGAHHDTKIIESIPDFQGANDGASGTGLILAIIESLKKSGYTPFYTLKFVFLDGEECRFKYSENDGLHGSKRLAGQILLNKQIDKCKAVIILDMVGDKDLNVAIPAGSDKKLAEILFGSAEKLGKEKYFTWSPTDMIDDHTPFQKLGIPSIDIIDFSYGNSNLFWHSSEDTVDKISAESLDTVGNTVIGMLHDMKSGLSRKITD